MPQAAEISPPMHLGYTDAATGQFVELEGHEIRMCVSVEELVLLKAGDPTALAALVTALNTPRT